jgi:TIR domain/Ribosomal RNA adenine dimethylase
MPVFISYSSRDKKILNDTLIRELNLKKVLYSSDQGIENGEEIPNKLRQIIQECEVCILLATSNSVDSEWCKMEIAAFWSAGKRLFLYSPDGSITSADLPKYLHNLNCDGTVEEIVESARQEIEKFAIKGPPELIEETKKLISMIELSKIGKIQALNESPPMLKVALEYFAATRRNIDRLKSEHSRILIPATEYPSYLISLQRNSNIYVRAIAVIDEIEKFWDGHIGKKILDMCTPNTTKRVFVLKDQIKYNEIKNYIERSYEKYHARLTFLQSVMSNFPGEDIHNFSLIWWSDREVNMSDPPPGTILARYHKFPGNNEIEFVSDPNLVEEYWQWFINIYENAINPEEFRQQNKENAINPAKIRQQNKEMSAYIPKPVEHYEALERLHPYFREMQYEMLAQLRTWERNSPKIWEVAAGTGILSEEIVKTLKTNGGNLLSLELDWVYFRVLSSKFRQNSDVRVMQEDPRYYDSESKFDLIFSSLVEHYIVRNDKDAEQYYENIRKNIVDSDISFFIVGDAFLREHDPANSDERTEAIRAYHNHIIEQARIEMERAPAGWREDYQGLIELETEAMASGIDPTSPNSGDYKVSISHFRQRIERAGLRIDSIVPIGPQDESIRNHVGGIFVIKIRLP